MQPSPPQGQWIWIPAQPVQPRRLPVHDWYDYVIAGVALALLIVIVTVMVIGQIQ